MNVAYMVLGVVAAGVILFGILGGMSQSGNAPGLTDGKLARCPASPNCVCSEFKDDGAHHIEPIILPGDLSDDVMARLTAAVVSAGGTLETVAEDYFAATFSSAVFRFVDDVEVRIARERNTIHLRSASRVGYGDAGVNRKRVERLKQAMVEALR